MKLILRLGKLFRISRFVSSKRCTAGSTALGIVWRLCQRSGRWCETSCLSSGNEPMLLWSVQSFCHTAGDKLVLSCQYVAIQSRCQVNSVIYRPGVGRAVHISGQGQASRDNCTASVVGLFNSITIVLLWWGNHYANQISGCRRMYTTFWLYRLRIYFLCAHWIPELQRELRWRLRWKTDWISWGVRR